MLSVSKSNHLMNHKNLELSVTKLELQLRKTKIKRN